MPHPLKPLNRSAVQFQRKNEKKVKERKEKHKGKKTVGVNMREICIKTSWVALSNVSHMTSRQTFVVCRRNDVVTSQVADAADTVLLRWNGLMPKTYTHDFHSRQGVAPECPQ